MWSFYAPHCFRGTNSKGTSLHNTFNTCIVCKVEALVGLSIRLLKNNFVRKYFKLLYFTLIVEGNQFFLKFFPEENKLWQNALSTFVSWLFPLLFVVTSNKAFEKNNSCEHQNQHPLDSRIIFQRSKNQKESKKIKSSNQKFRKDQKFKSQTKS